jgi:hypothetical protein
LLDGYLRQNKRFIRDEIPMRYSNIDDKLGLPSGSTKKYIKQVANDFNCIAKYEGDEYITLMVF